MSQILSDLAFCVNSEPLTVQYTFLISLRWSDVTSISIMKGYQQHWDINTYQSIFDLSSGDSFGPINSLYITDVHFNIWCLVILFDFMMFCFIFSFMFEFCIVELDLSSFLTQYIFCISLRLNKNTFLHSLEHRKTLHLLILIVTLVFDFNLDSFYLDFVHITSHAM